MWTYTCTGFSVDVFKIGKKIQKHQSIHEAMLLSQICPAQTTYRHPEGAALH